MPAGPVGSAPQSGPATATWNAVGDPEQNRFDAFKAEPPAKSEPEAPVPQVRNGRVLAIVLVAAALILAIPFSLLWLLGLIGGEAAPATSSTSQFNPEVGSCVKNGGDDKPVAVECTDIDAFKVVSKVDAAEKCEDPQQPHVTIPAADPDQRVLCLQPAAKQ